MKKDFVKVIDLHKNFGELKVLQGINLSIEEGEFIAIVGASGTGKSTLLQIIGSLESASKGSVWINDIEVSSLKSNQKAYFRNKKIGFIFQFHELLPEFSAEENVAIPAMIAGDTHTKALEKARKLLFRLGLSERLAHSPRELSGGEKQRVAIARALVNEPDLLLADEPSGSLDRKTKEEFHSLLLSIRKELKQTIIVVTHDTSLAKLADRTVVLDQGKIM